MLKQMILACVALILLVTPGFGQTQPKGPVILTVTGLDEAAFPGGQMAYDREMLAALGEASITTSSIWTEGTHVFDGVRLIDLIRALKIDAPVLRLHALNKYSVEFPVTEATQVAPLLAFAMDGVPMSVRDKGPVWVIYPYDSSAAYRTDQIFSRSIWQLDRIELLR